jgi:hypothetical protein
MMPTKGTSPLQKKPVPTKAEAELMDSLASVLSKGLGMTVREATYPEFIGNRKFLYLPDPETKKDGCKVIVRKTHFYIDLEVHETIRDKVIDVLGRNGLEFIDAGMFLQIVTPWQQGYFNGLSFPDISPGVHNYGRIKIINTAGRQSSETKGMPTFQYQIMDGFTSLGSVEVPVGRPWAANVSTSFDNIPLVLAMRNKGITFPFQDFLIRDIETRYPHALQEELTQYKIKIQEKYLKKGFLRKSTGDWTTTDPSSHHHERFRYLVHGISDGGRYVNFESADANRKYGSMYTESTLSSPKSFLKRPYISCSVIDQEHRTPWLYAGLILSVPRENIRMAYPADICAFVKEDGSQDYDSALPDAEEILQRTDPKSWNEVVISAQNEKTGSKIEIAGGFVCVNPKGKKPSDPYTSKSVKEFCMRRKLPVVELVDDEHRRYPVPGWAAEE